MDSVFIDRHFYRFSDDQEAEALVVQQKDKVKKDTSSVVACKRQSCFKSGRVLRTCLSIIIVHKLCVMLAFACSLGHHIS